MKHIFLALLICVFSNSVLATKQFTFCNYTNSTLYGTPDFIGESNENIFDLHPPPEVFNTDFTQEGPALGLQPGQSWTFSADGLIRGWYFNTTFTDGTPQCGADNEDSCGYLRATSGSNDATWVMTESNGIFSLNVATTEDIDTPLSCDQAVQQIAACANGQSPYPPSSDPAVCGCQDVNVCGSNTWEFIGCALGCIASSIPGGDSGDDAVVNSHDIVRKLNKNRYDNQNSSTIPNNNNTMPSNQTAAPSSSRIAPPAYTPVKPSNSIVPPSNPTVTPNTQ